jgi:hypothetical protein
MHSTAHIIATFRSKTETVQNSDKKVVKLGMKAESRDNVEYEYSIFFELTHDGHFATASKDRTELFEGRNFVITPETGKEIVNWLNSGKETKEEPKPTEKPKPVEAIVMPEKPCLIEKSDWVDFGRKMAAAIQASAEFGVLAEWLEINKEQLEELEKASPKMRVRLTELEGKQLEHLSSQSTDDTPAFLKNAASNEAP